MFTRIDHVAFAVKDRQKSIDFYEKNFGFNKFFEHDVPGVPELEKVVYLQLGDTILELEHWSKDEVNKGYHFCIISDNFDSDYQRLMDAGVVAITDVHIPRSRLPKEVGWKRVVFKGLDGELIEIRG